MRLQAVLLASSFSVALLGQAATAQEEKGCCSAKVEVSAESLVKDLKAATAKVHALPKEEKAAAITALQGAAQACPVAHASLQVVSVLQQAADALDAGGCCAEATAKDDAAKAKAARFQGLRAVLAAHVALLDEVGLPRVAPDCCAKNAKDAKAAATEAAKDCCEAGKESKDKGCCETAGAEKFVACATVTTKACSELPAKLAALDAKAKEKSNQGGVVLEKLGLRAPVFAAMAFYAEGLAAAAKDCGAAPEAPVVKGLAEMTAAFMKGAGTGGDCCTDKKGGDCCTEKKDADCCTEKTEKAKTEKKSDLK